MKTSVRVALSAASLILGGTTLAQSQALAQDPWPTRPVRIVVPYPPGGPVDVIARLISPKLSEQLHQPILVENQVGAGGNIGIVRAAKSEPNGYTVLLPSSSFAVNVSLQNTGYDPLHDFIAVVLVASQPNSSASRVKVLPDVPTFVESGFPMEHATWTGFFVPAGTSSTIVQKLNEAVNQVLQRPDILQRLDQLAFEPHGGTPQQFAEYVRAEIPKWGQIIRERNIKVQ